MTSINRQEKKVLFNQKLNEEKTMMESDWEIERDVAFQKNLTRNFSNLKRENDILIKENDSLKKRLNEIKKDKLIKGLANVEIKINNNSNYVGSINHCSRILKYLKSESNPQNITKITEDCMMTNNMVKACLSFLMTYNLVKKENCKSVKVYSVVQREV